MTKGNVTEIGLLKFFMSALSTEECINKKDALSEVMQVI